MEETTLRTIQFSLRRLMLCVAWLAVGAWLLKWELDYQSQSGYAFINAFFLRLVVGIALGAGIGVLVDRFWAMCGVGFVFAAFSLAYIP